MKTALFPGSFDPYTVGHHDIVLRSMELFDKIIIGLGKNSNKSRYFSLEIMHEKVKSVYKDMPHIEVDIYEGLTAEYAKQKNARYIIRGVRNTTDFEYENSISQANKFIWKDLETIFLFTSPTLGTISSTIIRDIHRYGKDVSSFLPYSL